VVLVDHAADPLPAARAARRPWAGDGQKTYASHLQLLKAIKEKAAKLTT
jgi:hypothetical protein